MAKIECCEGGVEGLASYTLTLFEKSSLEDSNGNPVVAVVKGTIKENVVLDGDGCVIEKLLEEGTSGTDMSLPCPKCRRTVNYRSGKI